MALDTSAVVSLLGAAFSVGSAIWIHTRQLKLQLFEKRLAVYDAACAFLAHPLQHGRPHEMSQCHDFRRDTRNATFLFGPEIERLLDRIYRKALEYRAKYKAWDGKLDGDPAKEVLNEQQLQCDQELDKLWKPVRREFRKYLKLTQIGPEFD